MKNNSDVKVMLKEALILLLITLGAGFLLGFVYELTKEPIALQQQKAINGACRAVFADASEFTEYVYVMPAEIAAELDEAGVEIGTVYEAKNASGTVLGYVIESTSGEGYGGDIVLYVGITIEGKLNDISILEISETPGLGMLASKVLGPQFHDKTEDSFTYTKTGSTADNEIDAISGATITTEAVTNAVNGALRVAGDISSASDAVKEGE